MKVKDTISFLIDKIKMNYPECETRSIAFLVMEHYGFTKKDILLKGDEDIDSPLFKNIKEVADQLSTGKPLQYIFGSADFYGLVFNVNENVLIPRPETEELVDLVKRENLNENPEILDIGTGSGCIAISLARFIPGAVVTATDISLKTLEIAYENAKINGADVTFIRDDIFASKISGNYNIIVSNPPYVTESEKINMWKNVLDFEPAGALFVPDEDPLMFYRKIAETGDHLLYPQGKIYLEINENYGNEVRDLFNSFNYENVEIIKDINNKDRILKAFSKIKEK